MKNILLVFAGGGGGSLLRYFVTLLIPARQGLMPWSTFAVNITGSLLLGYLSALWTGQADRESSLLFLGMGFCGGFTTFSTFSKEAYLMLQQQQWFPFIFYTAASLLCCLLGTAIGFYWGR